MKHLKILSWNIEHFDGHGGKDKNNKTKRKDRVKRVCEFLKAEDPDIFGLSEVEGKVVHEQITAILPDYTFSITEGRQSQELLIGVKHGLTSFFTQRNEFRRSNPYLRPGALLTVTVNNEHYPILFTHLKSMPSPEGFGLRDAMFDKALNLKKALDKVAKKKQSNFIILGDMNTMGLNYVGKKYDIKANIELLNLKKRFRKLDMTFIKKDHGTTFNNGSKSSYKPSDLDHVIAANHLRFVGFSKGAKVYVGGWAKKKTSKDKDKWIAEFSDHAPLSFTLKV